MSWAGDGGQEVGRLAGGPRRAGAQGEPDLFVAVELVEQGVEGVEDEFAWTGLDLAPVDVGADQLRAEGACLGNERFRPGEEAVVDAADDAEADAAGEACHGIV